jgi:hypothetical protein
MRVEEAGPEAIEDLVEQLADLRHDLGKYICFETRFVGIDAPETALREALKADLERTRCRRNPDGVEITESAWDLWARIRPGSLKDDPDITEIDALIGRLSTADLSADVDALRKTAENALEVASVTRRLLDRGRAALAKTQGGLYG